MTDTGDGGGLAEALDLVAELVEQHVTTLVWGGSEELRGRGGPLVEWLAQDTPLAEVVGKLTTLAHYAPLIHGFERELGHLNRLGQQLNQYFNEIDQEMRLAGRLQHDFLPARLPSVPPYYFHAMYRPASWVSGDMYDAFRVDERYLGLFVADAMGHGVAAGLLTMFLRQALVAKRVHDAAYDVLAPGEALGHLHAALLRQKLPNSQFVTGVYGVLDAAEGVLRVARAGHPYPLHITPDGQVHEVRVDGMLLGLADVPGGFGEVTVPLSAGHKIVFYTDGLEDSIIAARDDQSEETEYAARFLDWARRPAAEMIRAIEEHLDCREGSLHPADDVTVLILEVGGDGGR